LIKQFASHDFVIILVKPTIAYRLSSPCRGLVEVSAAWTMKAPPSQELVFRFDEEAFLMYLN
jgi:hypothetical protein